MAGFEELGGDVVVKPLFGSEGRGMTRVSDPDMAYRVFKALEMGRYIFYIQEFLDHGNEDVRLFVVGGRVIGSMLRRGASWKTNLAAGARGVPFEPDEEMVDMAIRSAEAIEADYAGVDVLMCASGRRVVEVNTIPAWAGLKEATGVDAGEALVSYALGLSG
jgi:ribosomal protein S6--L-glutamate ligase/tetrahydromethanopterin:alpha-L-glutamate ligase